MVNNKRKIKKDPPKRVSNTHCYYREDYLLTASFSALPGLNLGAFEAGT